MDITKHLQEEADKKEISIRSYNVIYKLVDDVKMEINNQLPPVDAEEVIGIYERSVSHRRKFISISARLFSRRPSECTAGVRDHRKEEEIEGRGLSVHQG